MSDVALRSLTELTRVTAPLTVEDASRSWLAVLGTAALTVAALAAAAYPFPVAIRLPASVLTALLFVRMFVIYHDFEHHAILRGSRLARILLTPFGLFVLAPPAIWNRLHNYHHSHNCQFATSGAGSFPVMTVKDYRAAPWRLRLRYRLIRSGWSMLFAYFGVFLLSFCTKSLRDDSGRHVDSAVALTLHAALIAAYWHFGLATLLYGFLGPLMCAHAIGTYLFYAQHNYPGVRLRPRQNWDYLYAAIYSSSFMQGGRFVNWFTANIGYHHVHHLNSRIPFYRLPEAIAVVPELQQAGRTSLRLSDIAACLRLKLWDSERQCMTGYPPE
jgi:omega-6 fatty acid desaturase (delta-12 desaturase)